MSYFGSAQETARVLGVPLLLRGDADPSCLVRHERLSRYAAPTAHAARLHARFREVLQAGAGGWPSGGQVIWVAGPWGTLEHLPWAVGLADQLARGGSRVWLAERVPDGPISALAPGVRPAIEAPESAGIALGATSLVDAGSDLAGVRLLLAAPVPAPASAPGAAAARRHRAGWLILADALPEDLEGSYPGADGIDGVVLVAAFRDHGRYELEAIARGLRAAGHRVIGLVAVGPEAGGGAELRVTDTAVEAEVAAAGGGAELRVTDTAVEAEVAAATEGDPTSPEPAIAEPEVVEPGDAEPEDAEPEIAEPEVVEPEVAEPEVAEPEIAEPEVVEPEVAEPPAATAEGTSLETAAPGTGETAGVDLPVAEPTPGAAPERPVARLSAWDQAASVERRRSRAWTRWATIAALIAAIGILYLLFLRPRGIGVTRKPAASPAARAVPGEAGGGPGPREGGRLDAIPASTDATGPAALDEPFGRVQPEGGDSVAVPGGPDPEMDGSADVSADVSADGSSPGMTAGTAAGSAPPPPSAPPPEGEPAAVAPPPAAAGTGEFVIHLSSFKLAPEAEEELARLRALGIEARSLRVEVPGRGSWYRIVAGRFASFAEAESVALSWEVRGLIPYAHIAPDGGRGTPVLAGARDNPRP